MDRFSGAPDDPAVSQALVAFATDGSLIGTAVRPHAGVGQAQAHRTLSTGVIGHTLTFHESCRAGFVQVALSRARAENVTGIWPARTERIDMHLCED